jgi:hypothetical protein
VTNITKDQIWDAEDLPTEDIEVPEWGGTITLRTMTGSERDEFESTIQSKGGGGKGRMDLRGLKARLVQLTAVNGDGLMFARADIPKLQSKSAAVLSRMADVALRLNGFTAQDVEDLAGNSPDDPSDDSGSG